MLLIRWLSISLHSQLICLQSAPAQKIFDKNKVHYIVFSDNNERAAQFMNPLTQYGHSWTLVDENVVVSIQLMAMCNHHILTSSTLSFWGA